MVTCSSIKVYGYGTVPYCNSLGLKVKGKWKEQILR